MLRECLFNDKPLFKNVPGIRLERRFLFLSYSDTPRFFHPIIIGFGTEVPYNTLGFWVLEGCSRHPRAFERSLSLYPLVIAPLPLTRKLQGFPSLQVTGLVHPGSDRLLRITRGFGELGLGNLLIPFIIKPQRGDQSI